MLQNKNVGKPGSANRCSDLKNEKSRKSKTECKFESKCFGLLFQLFL